MMMTDRVQRQYSESVLNTCMISFNLLFQPKCCLNYVLKYHYGDRSPVTLSGILL